MNARARGDIRRMEGYAPPFLDVAYDFLVGYLLRARRDILAKSNLRLGSRRYSVSILKSILGCAKHKIPKARMMKPSKRRVK